MKARKEEIRRLQEWFQTVWTKLRREGSSRLRRVWEAPQTPGSHLQEPILHLSYLTLEFSLSPPPPVSLSISFPLPLSHTHVHTQLKIFFLRTIVASYHQKEPVSTALCIFLPFEKLWAFKSERGLGPFLLP